MADTRDVSGVWYGTYRGGFGSNGFIAALVETGCSFGGSITERNPNGGVKILRATVSGQRNGAALRFIKQYDGGSGWVHAVRYAGQIDDEGTLISGVWQVDWLQGTFTMERDKFTEEMLEAEEETELPVVVDVT